jgi:hypothetical protein
MKTFWSTLAAILVSAAVIGSFIEIKWYFDAKAATEAAQQKFICKKGDEAVAAFRKANGLSELSYPLSWHYDWEAKYGNRSYQPLNPDLQQH